MQLVVFPIKIDMHLNVKLPSEGGKTLNTTKQAYTMTMNILVYQC